MLPVLTTAAGLLLLLAAIVLLIPLPEVGLPLGLVELRLLGSRYEWARRANSWIDRQAGRVRGQWRQLPRPLRLLTLVLLAGAAIGLAWLLIFH